LRLLIALTGRPHAARGLHQATNVGIVQFHPAAALEPARQQHGTVADADQAADRVTHGFHHATHFPVSTF
jgi:hypothetical protein